MTYEQAVSKAADYAAKLIREKQHAIGLCMYIAAQEYEVSTSDVARLCGKRGYAVRRSRAKDNKQLDLFKKENK